ncbi:MAG TPA: YciI family protein [Burkholderiales bacterium]|nr:YciI family protein [Burkholderiales bacterium]
MTLLLHKIFQTEFQAILYIIYQEDAENSAGLRALHKAAHFAYLEQHRDILVLGGAMLADDGVARTGSVLILNVADRAAAEHFSANEPLRCAGVFKSVKITRMRRGQWNPAAAPATPEGN